MSMRPTVEVLAESFGVRPAVAAPDLFARTPGASPFDLEAARTVLGWRARDGWRDLVARNTAGAA